MDYCDFIVNDLAESMAPFVLASGNDDTVGQSFVSAEIFIRRKVRRRIDLRGQGQTFPLTREPFENALQAFSQDAFETI